MRKIFIILLLILLWSCNRSSSEQGENIITVTIAPYKYFIKEIAGNDFAVNIMVPSGANPHLYEPYPDQINRLRKSAAYVSNGFLGFEMAWMERFEEINKTMKKVSAGERIVPIDSHHEHGNSDSHSETADPHYWVSPKCAFEIARSVKDLVCGLNPDSAKKYEKNYEILLKKIGQADRKADSLFSVLQRRHFLIYHPNLAYLARDYGLVEIAVEYEGKEPPPSRLKELIDLAAKENIKTIFVQKEYDSRNAKAIADETGGEIRVIDPLSENWYNSTMDIIEGIHSSLTGSGK